MAHVFWTVDDSAMELTDFGGCEINNYQSTACSSSRDQKTLFLLLSQLSRHTQSQKHYFRFEPISQKEQRFFGYDSTYMR